MLSSIHENTSSCIIENISVSYYSIFLNKKFHFKNEIVFLIFLRKLSKLVKLLQFHSIDSRRFQNNFVSFYILYLFLFSKDRFHKQIRKNIENILSYDHFHFFVQLFNFKRIFVIFSLLFDDSCNGIFLLQYCCSRPLVG